MHVHNKNHKETDKLLYMNVKMLNNDKNKQLNALL